MNDPGFNTLLKWGLSGGTENLDPNAQNAFLQMLGYELPTEADNMRLYMYNILMHKDAKQDLKEDATEQEKKDAQNAFDLIQWCFEELETSAGQIDSGNNLEVLRVNDWVKKVQEKVKENKDVKEKPAEIEGGNLTLWENLVALLEHEKAQIREGAAWCLATAVDNNSRNQNKVCNSFVCRISQSANDPAVNHVQCRPNSCQTGHRRRRHQSQTESHSSSFIGLPK